MIDFISIILVSYLITIWARECRDAYERKQDECSFSYPLDYFFCNPSIKKIILRDNWVNTYQIIFFVWL